MLRAALVAVAATAAGLGWYRLVVADGPPGPLFLVLLGILLMLGLALAASLRAHATPHWPTVRALWLSVLIAALTYSVIDVTAGWLLIEPLSPPTVADPVVHHRLVPGVDFEGSSDDYHYTLRVNTIGTRGADVEQPKPRGTYRIAMLGDSFTLGKGVNDDQTFAALTETLLNRRLAADPGVRFEVINAGVDSYSPILSYLQLRHLVPAIAPDLVVLNLDVSDLEQDAVYRTLARRDANGAIVAIPSGEYAGEIAWTWIDQHLYVTRLILHLVAGLAQAEAESASVRSTVLTANRRVIEHTLEADRVAVHARTAQWRQLFESIRAISEFCAQARIPFLLTVYPWGHQVGPEHWREGRKLFLEDGDRASARSLETVRALAAEHGIDLVDAFPAFREQAGERLYFERDLHWTAAGHRLMADVLVRALAARLGADAVLPVAVPLSP